MISIVAQSTFHPVSAYEFEFLKTEEVVRERLGSATIYLIGQRPLTYFRNVRNDRGDLLFDIVDRVDTEPLACRFSPSRAGLVERGSTIDVELQFYTEEPTSAPYDHVAGIKVFGADHNFKYWMGPQKFIAAHLSGSPGSSVLSGDPLAFVDFRIHYIGKAFDQKIWKRLTGHHKLQRILTMEPAMSKLAKLNAFEITLLMLEIVGADEMPIIGDWQPYARLGPKDKPIVTELSDKRAEDFIAPSTQPDAAELTTELEAILVHAFRPEYNEIKFESYPDIAGGTRSVGYSRSELKLERLNFRIFTEFDALGPVVPSRTDWRVRRWQYGVGLKWNYAHVLRP